MELNIGAIFISNKILQEKEYPAWMYREETEKEGDSGWRVFSGTEDDKYLNNPQNFKLISADELIKIDNDIKVNLLAPFGFAFEKKLKTGQWEMIDDE